IQSNGIEDREFNSNRGIHLFFTVNEQKRQCSK
ncbi:putative transcription-associated protein, partial [Trichinella pseudospiralis]